MSSKKIQALQQPSPVPQPRFNRIVLIDDSDIDLFINEAILKAIALTREVKKVLQPELVINELKNAERLSDIPELIFLDLDMKNMGGFAFLEQFIT